MLNRIVLIGRLTADPEVRYTQSGVAVANMRMAVDRNYKDQNGERPTDFINLVAWRKAAELISQYMKKGRMMAVEGSLQMRQFQTKEGENRTVYEVLIENFQFLDRGESGGGGSRGPAPGPSDADAPPSSYGGPEPPPEEDDLPF